RAEALGVALRRLRGQGGPTVLPERRAGVVRRAGGQVDEEHRPAQRLVVVDADGLGVAAAVVALEEDAVAGLDGVEVVLPVRDAEREHPLDALLDAARLIAARPPAGAVIRMRIQRPQRRHADT